MGRESVVKVDFREGDQSPLEQRTQPISQPVEHAIKCYKTDANFPKMTKFYNTFPQRKSWA